MDQALLLVGLVVAGFAGYAIGGTSVGPAFAPAVGANVITKLTAAALMAVFFFIGAYTIGRRVVQTLGADIMHDPTVFTLQTSVVILFFIGFALTIGNLFGVPSSTSMSTVGAIGGLGLATGELNWAIIGEIAIWWIVSPVIAFWLSAVIGRYLYPQLNEWIAIERGRGRAIVFEWFGPIPYPRTTETSTRREVVGALVVIAIGCLMAFSAGTSNIANVIAPLVGSGELALNPGIVFGSIAVAVGAFTIGRRTMETLGSDITDMPLTAAIVVAVISGIIVVLLSWIGIPASFVVIATFSIVGLGWGRATRMTPLEEGLRAEIRTEVSVGALAADREGEGLPGIGEERPEDIPSAADLFDPSTTARVVALQNLVPIIATVGSYLTFVALPIWNF